MFKPDGIYYEKEIENYKLGKELLEKYKDVPKKIIEPKSIDFMNQYPPNNCS